MSSAMLMLYGVLLCLQAQEWRLLGWCSVGQAGLTVVVVIVVVVAAAVAIVVAVVVAAAASPGPPLRKLAPCREHTRILSVQQWMQHRLWMLWCPSCVGGAG